jgi:nitrate/TMAO reductase-like tetraheme cytochrome c subunit
MAGSIVFVIVGVACALALIVGLRPQLTRTREGKILAFVALFLLPGVTLLMGISEHMEHATSTKFCLSCHVMHDYGQSLLIDDPSYLPARHFQNNNIPRDHACFTCHTTYTMFGDLSAKIRGFHHLRVQYLGTVPAPQDIKLYEPFNNRECLHCHAGARNFEDASPHKKTPDILPNVKSGKLSCVSGGCHEFIHDAGSIKDQTIWKGTTLE